MKMKNEELSELLKEADFSEAEWKEAMQVLEAVAVAPEVMARAEPPPAYEDHLIHSLRSQLALERPSIWERAVQWCRRPVVSWSFASGFAVLAVISAVWIQGQQSGMPVASHDLIVDTLKRVESESVERWIASVGGSGSYAFNEQRLADMNPRQLERAIRDIEGKSQSL